METSPWPVSGVYHRLEERIHLLSIGDPNRNYCNSADWLPAVLHRLSDELNESSLVGFIGYVVLRIHGERVARKAGPNFPPDAGRLLLSDRGSARFIAVQA